MSHATPPCPEPAPAPAYPFSALVGQPLLQRALLLVAVDPAIGGVLVRGPRGTAKSTAARALASLLPCAPFVTLPLAASLEQLVGSLDVEDALQAGRVRLKPGLLARADGGVLYVDEVNLLGDALVDALLDAAASGVHSVERDGISRQHPSRFVLVGTMNPEEGELRPQLLDRFGLAVTLDNPADTDARVEILRARLAFDANPAEALRRHAAADERLRVAITQARQRLSGLAWPDAVITRAATLAQEAAVDGLRADLVMLRAARALAALQGAEAVRCEHVDAVAEAALGHRRGEGSPVPAPSRSTNPAPGTLAQRPANRADGEQAASAPRWPDQDGHDPGPAGGGAGAEADAGARSGIAAEGDWGALPPQPAAIAPVGRLEAWRPKA